MKYLFISLLTALALSGCNDSAEKEGPGEIDPIRQADGTDFDFEGLAEKEAEVLAAKRELKHRVVWRDGQPLTVTLDFRPDRVNFTIEKGKVTKTSRG